MSRLDAQLALMALDTVSDYPRNWMYIIPSDSISDFQCLGCLDLCGCNTENYQDSLEAHSSICKSSVELAISRFELLSVLEQIAKLEYQARLNAEILSNILSKGGAWALMAKELGWLMVVESRYVWEADFNKVVKNLNINENIFTNNNPNGIAEWLERINKKENNG